MNKIALTFLVAFFSTFGFAQSPDEQIGNCLNTSDFFLLEEIYPTIKNDVQIPVLNTFAESLLYAAFNNPEQAVSAIDSLIAKYQGEIGLENVRNMLINQCWMLFRKGEYQDGYNRLKSFIEQLEPHMPVEFLAGSKANLRLYKAFLDESKPRLDRPNVDCVIPMEIDTIRIKGNEDDTLRYSTLMFVPVVVNGQQERFIFDTGCGGGIFLSQEYANRLGARIKMDSLSISGSGGHSSGQMAIIDSIQVGNMIFKNVTATIMMPNLQVDTLYKVDAVLGVDIMDYAGEVQIFPNEKKIVFPINKTSLPATGKNMMRMLGGDAFFLKAYSGDERLTMLFDTGDVYSHFNEKYYNVHKEYVNINGLKESKISGGFGGTKQTEFYSLPSFSLKIGNKQFEIKHMIVGSNLEATSQQFGFGALGMAFINAFDKVTISFDEMFVEVE